MDKNFENLLEILEKEVDVYHEFLSILQVERQYMVDLSLDKLHECANHKETIILNLKILEESRVDVTGMIQDEYHSGPLTLLMIINIAPMRYKKALESCRSNLLSLVNSIREINQINGILAERAVNYTRTSLTFLNRLIHELPVYRPTGQIEQGYQTGKLVCKKA
ncbi:MAG: flagellar protein FlgN [Nitrospirae bacterium]|nr:flagellar protein FlgN [Nitrospirota bacterium]